MDLGERSVSLTCVTAWVLWGMTFALILAGTIVGVTGGDGNEGKAWHLPVALSLIAHGLACSAGAATVSIRAMLREHDRLLKTAFALGQDSNGVRRVR